MFKLKRTFTNDGLSQKIRTIFEQIAWAYDPSDEIQELQSGRYGDPFPVLIPYLTSGNSDDASAAMYVMMNLDVSQSIPYIVPLMEDPEWQCTICYWIVKLGDTPEVIEPVIHILHFGPDAGTRVMAVGALARIGDERAIPALEAAMKHDHALDGGGHSVASTAPDAIHAIRTRLKA